MTVDGKWLQPVAKAKFAELGATKIDAPRFIFTRLAL